MAQIVIGTAGHIDHGKTSLVKSLTGTETDSLNEEKKRGMTIDLGFAYLNNTITIIDVPGHEKFIKNMTAGAANIHYGLIVVAADDGIMPQTVEHLNILNILGIKGVWVAITKIDIVKDNEWIDLIELEINEYLLRYNFEIFSCNRINNLSGQGVNKLKNSIMSFATDKEMDKPLQYFRMNVDRSFIKKGFGTIVTGTVAHGKAKIGDSIEVLPNSIHTKIRGIQTHGRDTQLISKGDRAAVNLLNVKLNELYRGIVISTPRAIKNTKQIIAKITMINETNWVLKNQQRLRLHFGTDEVLARVTIKNQKKFKKGDNGNIIFTLESKIPVCLEDKFVIRSYSPMNTIAGGTVLITDVNSYYDNLIDEIPMNPKDRFIFLLESNWEEPFPSKRWQKIFLTNHYKIEEWCKEFKIHRSASDILFTSKNVQKGKQKTISFLKKFHSKNSLRIGCSLETISSSIGWHQDFLKIVLNGLIKEKKIEMVNDFYSIFSSNKEPLTKLQTEQIKHTENFIKKSGLTPVEMNAIQKTKKYKPSQLLEVINFLKFKDKIEDLGNNFFIHKNYFVILLDSLKKYFDHSIELTISDFKALSGLTRKTAIPLLEFLDKKEYTIRKDNIRLVGKNLND